MLLRNGVEQVGSAWKHVWRRVGSKQRLCEWEYASYVVCLCLASPPVYKPGTMTPGKPYRVSPEVPHAGDTWAVGCGLWSVVRGLCILVM
jgi:hypothetical protein